MQFVSQTRTLVLSIEMHRTHHTLTGHTRVTAHTVRQVLYCVRNTALYEAVCNGMGTVAVRRGKAKCEHNHAARHRPVVLAAHGPGCVSRRLHRDCLRSTSLAKDVARGGSGVGGRRGAALGAVGEVQWVWLRESERVARGCTGGRSDAALQGQGARALAGLALRTWMPR